MKLTPEAEKYLHGSCRHIDEKGNLVVVTANGIVTTPRPADKWELNGLTTFGMLCFASK